MDLNNAIAVNEALQAWRLVSQTRYGANVVYYYPSRQHLKLDDDASEVLGSTKWGPYTIAKAKDPLATVEPQE